MGRSSRAPIVFELDGDVKAYEQALAKIPGVTEKEAKKAADRFVKAQRAGYIRAQLEGEKAAKEVSSAWGDVGRLVGGALSGLAISAAVSSLASYAGALHDARTEAINLSAATGVSLETFAGLGRASARTGIEVGAMASSLGEFGKKIFEAGQGSGGAAKAFEVLGIETMGVDGNLRNADDVLREVLNKLPTLTDGTKRAAVAQELFGGAAKDVNAILAGAPLDAYIAQAKALGTVLDEDAVKSTKAWNAATGELWGAIDGIVGSAMDYVDVAGKLEAITTGLVIATTAWGESFRVTVDNATALFTLDWGSIEFPFAEAAKTAWEAGQATIAARKELEDYGETGEDTSKQIADLAETQAKAAAEEKKAAAERESAAKKWQAAQAKAAAEEQKAAAARQKEIDKQTGAIESLSDLFHDSTVDQASAYDLIRQEERARMDRLREIEAIIGESAATEAAGQEIRARAQRDLMEIYAESNATVLEGLTELYAQVETIEEAQRSRRAQNAMEWAQVSMGAADAIIGAIDDVAARQAAMTQQGLADAAAATDELRGRRAELRDALIEDEIILSEEQQRIADEAELAATERAIRVAKKNERQARDSAEAAWKIQKGAKIAEIGVSTAAAIVQAFAMFGPPPSPVGIASAATAAAVGASQAALAATTTPQFHDGGGLFQGSGGGYTRGPDEVQATLRGPERVLNQRAAENLGDEAIGRLNGGGSMGGGSSSVVLMVGGRQLGQAVVEELAAGRELSGAFNRRARIQASRRPVYAR